MNATLPLEAAQTASPDRDLALAAQRGDRRAFDLLAARYRSGAHATALVLARRFDVADDLAQEALCRAWESLHSLRDPQAFAPWLRAITVNCFRMWQRRPAQRDADLDEAAHERASQDCFAAARRREVQRGLVRALELIPRQNRVALLMRHFGGASYEDIATFLGVPVTTIEGRIYRAKLQLRPHLRGLFEDDAAATR